MHPFEIRFLDHVAIRVKDLEASAAWYEKTLGLKRYQLDAWGEFPIFLLAGKSGVALFPADLSHPPMPPGTRNIKIDHFAFNVSNEHLEKARQHYMELGIEFEFQDHTYFHSIYTLDPDGHTVELTTIVVDEDSFYK